MTVVAGAAVPEAVASALGRAADRESRLRRAAARAGKPRSDAAAFVFAGGTIV